jgi:secretion/DNA translocation related TadE-like protein
VTARDDEGSATVLAAAAVGVLVLLLGLGLQLGAAVLARHRAEAAADLAALAAARELVMGLDVACARGGEIAAAQGARMVSCTASGWSVTFVVVVSCRCVPSVSSDAVGRARAGPAVELADLGRPRLVTARDRAPPVAGRAEGGSG